MRNQGLCHVILHWLGRPLARGRRVSIDMSQEYATRFHVVVSNYVLYNMCRVSRVALADLRLVG